MSEMMFMPQDRVIEEMIINSALRDRRICFNQMVTRDSVFKIIHLIDRVVAIDKKENTKKDIEIVLDCEGGDIYSGLALVSKILKLRKMGYKVITTVHSFAMSMGFMFLIIGSHRRALQYSTIMAHQPSSETWGKLQDMKEDLEETERLWTIMKDIIKEHTNITEEQLEYNRTRKQDWFMDSKLALELGCIDEIL